MRPAAPIPAMRPAATGPFGWLRYRDLPAVRDYLAAERGYYDQQMAPLAGLQDELAAELTARLAPADEHLSAAIGEAMH